MKTKPILISFILVCFSFTLNSQNSIKKNKKKISTEWVVSSLLKSDLSNAQINGNPTIINSSFGEVVYFNGVDDALLLNEIPINNAKVFTLEMIFKPDENAPFEQRILHIGEIKGDRLLLEIRAVNTNWYFDGFVASGKNKLALIDDKLIHPLCKWYHVALVVTPNSLTTYVNGIKELHENYSFKPINNGKTSIGVRMNKVSWFKGTIYKIKITPKQLKPNKFMFF